MLYSIILRDIMTHEKVIKTVISAPTKEAAKDKAQYEMYWDYYVESIKPLKI